MKKALYTTTALAAAGMFAFSGADAVAAEKVKIGVGGYFIWAAGVSDSDSDMHKNQGSLNMISDSEIYFRGNTTLDNGIRIDVIVQLETDQTSSASGGSGNVIDESYLKVGNLKQWGEFRLGSTKQAHFLFRAMGPHVSTIVNATNGDLSSYFVPSLTALKGAGIGGHWAEREDDTAMSEVDNREGYMAGIGYKTGPWNMALTWLNTTDDQTDATGEIEHNQYTLGMTYSLGAGVVVGASVFSIDLQDEKLMTQTAGADTESADDDEFVSAAKDNEGWGALAGIRVNF